MKKILYLLTILSATLIFNVQSYAVTVPTLDISSNNYSKNAKMNKKEIKKLEVGQRLPLYALITYGNDMPISENDHGWFVQEANLNGVIWSSSNSNVASVNNNGIVTGISIGKTIITAKYNNEEATYEVEIKQKTKHSFKYEIIIAIIILLAIPIIYIKIKK